MNLPFLSLTRPSSLSLFTYAMCSSPWPTWWAFIEVCQCLSCTEEPKTRCSLTSLEGNNRFPQPADWTVCLALFTRRSFLQNCFLFPKSVLLPGVIPFIVIGCHLDFVSLITNLWALQSSHFSMHCIIHLSNSYLTLFSSSKWKILPKAL